MPRDLQNRDFLNDSTHIMLDHNLLSRCGGSASHYIFYNPLKRLCIRAVCRWADGETGSGVKGPGCLVGKDQYVALVRRYEVGDAGKRSGRSGVTRIVKRCDYQPDGQWDDFRKLLRKRDRYVFLFSFLWKFVVSF